jgi:hypothetical protein
MGCPQYYVFTHASKTDKDHCRDNSPQSHFLYGLGCKVSHSFTIKKRD